MNQKSQVIGSGENWHLQKGNDIKMGVIPSYEESLEVLFMINFIIFGSSGDASYVSMTTVPMMSFVGSPF
ncbi:hypothetical protein [Aquiflexum sp.]|uniref:hypothetical protein n=1 Tax=Aquiflexum sp. TaxID=1872584 RepID=UPI0035946B00